MGGSKFVTPSTVRIDLADDEWIEVKERLTYGEEQRLATAGLRGARGTGENMEVTVDWDRFNVARILTWVTDWSFRDERGKSVALTRQAVEALKPEAAREVLEALDAHVARIEELGKATPGKQEPATKPR